MLRFGDDRLFTTGKTPYRYAPISEEDSSLRIIVSVQVQGIDTEAVIDTGGIYFICSDQLMDALDLEIASMERIRMLIRGHWIWGVLTRLSLTLPAEHGEDLLLDVTAFVPDHDPDRIWDIPSFLGMQGCLEHIRLAIDPGKEAFYFGPVDWEFS